MEVSYLDFQQGGGGGGGGGGGEGGLVQHVPICPYTYGNKTITGPPNVKVVPYSTVSD